MVLYLRGKVGLCFCVLLAEDYITDRTWLSEAKTFWIDTWIWTTINFLHTCLVVLNRSRSCSFQIRLQGDLTICVRSEQFVVVDGKQIHHPKGWLVAFGSLRTCYRTLHCTQLKWVRTMCPWYRSINCLSWDKMITCSTANFLGVNTPSMINFKAPYNALEHKFGKRCIPIALRN